VVVIGHSYAAYHDAYVPCRCTRRVPKSRVGKLHGPPSLCGFGHALVFVRSVGICFVFSVRHASGKADFLRCFRVGAGLEKGQRDTLTLERGRQLGNVAFRPNRARQQRAIRRRLRNALISHAWKHKSEPQYAAFVVARSKAMPALEVSTVSFPVSA
jgi:hypothetical protein